MNKAKSDEMRKEYDLEALGPGVRGKYYRAYRKGTNLVRIQPELMKAFPTEEAVNDALRSLLEIARRTTKKSKRQNHKD